MDRGVKKQSETKGDTGEKKAFLGGEQVYFFKKRNPPPPKKTNKNKWGGFRAKWGGSSGHLPWPLNPPKKQKQKQNKQTKKLTTWPKKHAQKARTPKTL